MGPNPYETPQVGEMRSRVATEASLERIDRWGHWVGNSIGIYLVSLVFFAMLTCGCHFHWEAVPFSVLPIFWAAFTLVSYRTAGERIVTYVNIPLSAAWFWITWEGNLQFLARNIVERWTANTL